VLVDGERLGTSPLSDPAATTGGPPRSTGATGAQAMSATVPRRHRTHGRTPFGQLLVDNTGLSDTAEVIVDRPGASGNPMIKLARPAMIPGQLDDA